MEVKNRIEPMEVYIPEPTERELEELEDLLRQMSVDELRELLRRFLN